MVHYPPADTTTPLIIVGPPRSGTRFITNVLNAVPGVTIHGEIPGSILNNTIRTIKKCDRIYAKSKNNKFIQNWDSKKHDYMFAAWANLNKSKRIKADSPCLYYGYKTPFHEQYFDFYNKFFCPVQPRYVCCIRSFPDHLLSIQARWPKRAIPYIALRYIMSLRQITYMKKKASDHVLLFFLDDYKESKDRYLLEKIFKPLGLDDIKAALQKANMGPVNTSVQHGCIRNERLSNIQEFILRVCPWPLYEFEALHRDFG